MSDIKNDDWEFGLPIVIFFYIKSNDKIPKNNSGQPELAGLPTRNI